MQDWDSPEGAIDWDKQRRALQHLRDHGKLPDDHLSHDHLNEQVPVPISDELVSRWQARFEELAQEGHTLECILADGFLLYWDRSVVRDFYDVRIVSAPEPPAGDSSSRGSQYSLCARTTMS